MTLHRIAVRAALVLALLAGGGAVARPMMAPSGTAAAVQATDASLSEALRDRVDQLRYAADGGAPVVAGVSIALAEAVARHYAAS
ncbi:MAG: hypothetical protein U1F08_14655, partial [Steroidobacteraceae bacterium]